VASRLPARVSSSVVTIAFSVAVTLWSANTVIEAAILRVALRSQVAKLDPPWDYEYDAARLQGLVFEPLCPGRPTAAVWRSIAACEILDEKTLRVTLRTKLSRGGGFRPVGPADVLAALAAHYPQAKSETGSLITSTSTITINDRGVTFKLKRGDVVELMFSLGDTFLAFEEPDSLPQGTGPFFIHRRCTLDASAGVSPELDCAWAEAPSGWLRRWRRGKLDELAPWLTDDLVLQRREGDGIRFIDFISIISHERPAVDAIISALESERIHLAMDLRSVAGDVRPTPSSPWQWMSKAPDRVLVAALRPGWTGPCRDRIFWALHEARKDGAFVRSIAALPAPQLLAPQYNFVLPQPDVSEPSGLCRGETVRLLTNAYWDPVAKKLQERLQERSGAKILLASLGPGEESARRRDLDYELSLLAHVPAPQADAGAFVDDMATTYEAKEGWAGQTTGSSLTERVRRLGGWAVGLGWIQMGSAQSRRFSGLDATQRFFNPQSLTLAPQPYFLSPTAAVLIVVLICVLSLWAEWQIEKADRWRQDLSVRSQLLHHELSAPLATILAWASSLRDSDPEVAEAIRDQAEGMVNFVDGTVWAATGDGRWIPEVSGRCRLTQDVLQPATTRLQGACAALRVDLEIRVDPPATDIVVSMNAAAALTLVRNLFENAVKYRVEGSPVRLLVLIEASSKHVRVRVQDWGVGIDGPARKLFHFGYRSRAAAARGDPGLGYGLALCRAMLNAVGGQIELTGRREPTEFTVTLPRITEVGA
jgi:signal transduction histidine kinase